MMNGLIVGCGYLGQHVARIWNQQGVGVFALTRTQASADRLAEQSIQPIVVDWYQPDPWPRLPKIDQMLISVSHAPVLGLPATETHVLGLRNLLDRLTTPPARLAYLSTTGVYQSFEDGRWVDESSAVRPTRPGSMAAVAAERWLAEHVAADRLSILRAAGIYGPGRIPRLDTLRAGEPIDADPESYLNLIHVEDLAGIASTLLQHPTGMGVYNVSDGRPPLRRAYYRFIAELIGAPPPIFREPVSMSSGADGTGQRRRGEGNKRIVNRRVVEKLAYQFQFPDYIAGLSPLLSS